MSRVLVVYASKHGATVEIADAIAEGLTRRGTDAQVAPAESADSEESYDGFVVGSAVYTGHWLKPAREFVDSHSQTLAAKPVWLFSSGPLGPPEDLKPEGDPVDVEGLMEQSRALAHRVFAGKLDREKLGFGERAMVRAVHAPEGDFRDWEAIDDFAGEVANRLSR